MVTADEMFRQAGEAAREFLRFDQEATDRITRAVYLAAMDHRVRLAKMAVEETGLGIWQDKVVKNVIASQLVYEHIKRQRTVGIISEDSFTGIIEMARPIGPILALVPVINPTSTVFFKILIAMKSRNPLIVCAPWLAKGCVFEAARVCHEAARAAGAPEHCVQWTAKPSLEKTKELMSHAGVSLILATGTGELVKACYSSGTPTIGVGAGNVPVYIGVSADIPFAVRNIMTSKTFDNGSVCASEQAVVVKEVIAKTVVEEFERQGAHFLDAEGIERVARIAYDRERGTMTAAVVGQPVSRIAEMAGLRVPAGTRLLMGRLEGVSRNHPLSAEILAPILALFVEKDFEASIRRCAEVARFGGAGHTAVIYSNNPERIQYFAETIDVARILVNTPSTHGALGGMYNTLPPSFTLSCGSGGKNSTTDNISVRNLLNIHRICRRRENQRWRNVDLAKYLDETIDGEAIEREFYKNT
ncbi:MAG: aldehyde dehydrogenase family protein [Planctomycetes bacterium]|jgi:acetaldehyde dehydrogenase/alcohol dehydrogenase|nr:aldehyde dehydrogenase family protein [Planctomycetota bacterium]